MKKGELFRAAIITLALTVLDFTGYPAALFVHINWKDINPVFFVLMVNQWMSIAAGVIAVHFLCPNLKLKWNKCRDNEVLHEYIISGGLMAGVSLAAFYIGAAGHYDYHPTLWKVLIEGLFYYISVGIIEEIYIRGLLLNILEQLFRKQNNAVMKAILVSSVFFSLGHIPGMLQQDLLTIVCRVIWTFMLGVYLGMAYKRTSSIRVPIVLHILFDFCGVPFCFLSAPQYYPVTVVVIAVFYTVIAGWNIKQYAKDL